MLQVLVFIFCLKQNILQLHFWPLCQVFNAGVLLGDFLWYRVMFCEGLSHHPYKGYINTKFPLLLLFVFSFFATGKSVISSLFSWVSPAFAWILSYSNGRQKILPKAKFQIQILH